jgi:Barrel-sandwich domain of CusB or HlyD membrane-fusion/GAF domain
MRDMFSTTSQGEATVELPASATLPVAADPETVLRTILGSVATAVHSERYAEAATACVTALAGQCACDRVSLGMVKHGSVFVQALSHSARFDRKTDLLQTIGSAMEEALDQRAPVVFPPGPGHSLQITQAHQELANRYGSRAICSIPLQAHGKMIGVLTFERGTERPFDQQTVAVCEALGGLTGPVLELKRREDRWLIAKTWDAGREQLAALLGPGHLVLKMAVLTVVAVLIAFATITGDFRVTAKAVLEGEVQRAAVAPFQGFLQTAPVRAGDVVQDGQVLATLQDHDLRLERLKHVSHREELNNEYRKALSDRDAPKVEIAAAQLRQVDAELELATDKLARTHIVAPFDGVVVTGDWSQHLGAPVEEGKVLFEIAPLDTYRIVLQVDERDIAPMAVGQQGHLMLSAMPNETMPFTVDKITPVSTPKDGRNFFRVEGRLATPSSQLRPAMEGVGKVDIDQRRLIWIWTREAFDWVRLKLWAWLP